MVKMKIFQTEERNFIDSKMVIANMYRDDRKVYEIGMGVSYDSPLMILNSFEAVRRPYCKVNAIKTHYMEIFVEYEVGMPAAIMLAERVAHYFYQYGFQNYITVIDNEDRYMIAIALNSVSYKNGSLFHDNNACYIELFHFLCSVLPVGMSVSVEQNVVFELGRPKGNYCHGEYA